MIQIKIDGEVVFKGSAGEWESRPPSMFQDAIKPGLVPQPWMKAIAVTVVDALITDSDMRINVVTTGKGVDRKGWQMTVSRK